MKTSILSIFIFISILLSLNLNAQVAINTSGNAPDASSMLDITSSSTGILIPRVALTASNTAGPITLPLTSLLVYNTATASSGATYVFPGYYYNAGTTGTPDWQRVATNKDAWNLTGNYGTNPTNNFIGTADGQDLQFKTNNTNRIRIMYSTYPTIGIGTTAPVTNMDGNASVLHIHDGGSSIPSQLILSTHSTTAGVKTGNLIFAATQVTNDRRTGSIESYLTAYSAPNASGDLRFFTNNVNSYTEKMRIQANGNVGIGTTAPNASSLLDITSTTKGILIPRIALTASNVAAPITTPADALLIYNTATAGVAPNNVVPGYYFWSSTSSQWKWLYSGSVPNIPGNVEYWIRPTASNYIRPMYNPYIRVYDTLQTYGLYFDGAKNQYGGWFRTTGTYNPTAALVGFSDITGNQTYGYMGYNGAYSFGTPAQTINGSAFYGVVDDPDRTAGFFRTTLNASVAANINYSNVWIANYNYIENNSATYNPSASYSQLDLTNSTLGGNHVAIQGYANRGTTSGNPGFTIGVHGTADSQNENSIGVVGTAYSDVTAFSNNSFAAGGYGSSGGYFDFYNYALSLVYGYAYVAQYNGATQRKIIGVGSVSEIIPTPNHGRITLTCPESPEYWYIDYGSVNMENGKVHVSLDPILTDICIIDKENPIKVICQPNMEYCNGVAVINKNENGFDIIEMNNGTHSGEIDYQIVAKPKTNYGEGRFQQAPGPIGLKADEEPIKAKAKNQPNPSKIFHWKSDPEVYGYTLQKNKSKSINKQ